MDCRSIARIHGIPNQNGFMKQGGVWHALTANAKNSGLIRDGIVYAVSMDGRNKSDASKGIMPTLISPEKQPKVAVTAYAVDLYNGSMGGMFATIGANSCVGANHAGPAVCFRKSIKAAKNNDGDVWSQSDMTNTLNGFEFHSQVRTPEIVVERNRGGGYMFENHANDSRYTGPLKIS